MLRRVAHALLAGSAAAHNGLVCDPTCLSQQHSYTVGSGPLRKNPKSQIGNGPT